MKHEFALFQTAGDVERYRCTRCFYQTMRIGSGEIEGAATPCCDPLKHFAPHAQTTQPTPPAATESAKTPAGGTGTGGKGSPGS